VDGCTWLQPPAPHCGCSLEALAATESDARVAGLAAWQLAAASSSAASGGALGGGAGAGRSGSAAALAPLSAYPADGAMRPLVERLFSSGDAAGMPPPGLVQAAGMLR
jgi:hypothetical protein